MKYTRYDLGRLERGAVVVVNLKGNAANVRLMDTSNYQSHRNGRRHRYSGGLVKRSPLRLPVPSTGHWHVTVDLLRIGDSLRRKIDAGLFGSKFGVVVLSRSFFSKGWPQYELDGLITLHVSGEQNLLPIWHEITKAEVMAQSPSLADKIALSTTQHTIDEIAIEIAEVVRADLVLNAAEAE